MSSFGLVGQCHRVSSIGFGPWRMSAIVTLEEFLEVSDSELEKNS